MREIFVESELREFPLPAGFSTDGGATSVGEPLQGGRARAKPLFMHRLLAPDDLTQETLFLYRNWKSRRCYPDPQRPDSPLWWVVAGDAEHYVVVDGERRRATLSQIPETRLFDLADTVELRLPVTGEPAPLTAADETPANEPQVGRETFEDAPTGEVGRKTFFFGAPAPSTPEARPAATAALASETEERDQAPAAEAVSPPAAAGFFTAVAPEEQARRVLAQTPLPPSATSAEVRAVMEPMNQARTATEPASALSARPAGREDPFKRSLDQMLAELTAPLAVDPERQARVAVRVVTSPADGCPEGPVPLPSRPELVSSDFLAGAEVSRPALSPVPAEPRRATPRVPGRALALAAGVLILFASLAFLFFH